MPGAIPDVSAHNEAAVAQAMRLLERWRFAASASGYLWIQPVGAKLPPEELAEFLIVLRRGYNEDLPKVVLFDFTECEIAGAQWTLVETLLTEFARSVGAKCRVTSTVRKPVASILLYRVDSSAAAVTSCRASGPRS